MKGVSVIICCYNSAKRIKPTIEHLLMQEEIRDQEWEILLINNASTDNTIEVASQSYDNFFSKGKPVLRVIQENNPGLSNARIKGIHEAKYEYILFCDDDNWLCKSYLLNAKAIMDSDQNIGVLGGVGTPIFEGIEPPYFWINQYHALAVGPQWIEEGDITDTRGVVYGAGMVLRKAAFLKLINNYNFNFQASDRVGKSLVSSGDHELCLAIKMINYKVVWNKTLTFQHYIPVGRTTISYYAKLFKGAGLSSPMLVGYFLNKRNCRSIKYDWRYLSLRYFRNVIISYFKLLFSPFYFVSTEKKYKYLTIIQSLSTSYGCLLATIKFKNFYKNRFLKSPLFLDKIN